MIGSVSLVVNYFVSFKAASLDYAFLVGLYLLLIRKVLFQMAKRKCTFTNEMQEKHSGFRKVRNDYEAECLVCKPATYISAVHKGNGDLNTHLQSKKHRKAVRWAAASTKMTNYFVTVGSKCEDEITAAEGTLAFHSVNHHHSFLSMDRTSLLLKKIFPDSNVAEKFSSGRTKTEKVATSVLAQYSIDVVLKSFEENNIAYFGVATEGSNHNELKLFPIITQYFDWRKGGLQSKLIECTNKANETAETIAPYIKDTLDKRMLLKKCVAFTGDNCNTMFGGLRRNEQGNNVFAKLKKILNPSLIGIGCSAHVLNNCIHHGSERMNIDIKNNIKKIYQYFSIYTVRTEQLKEYCEFANCEYMRLLSRSKTRWLSLFPGISRLLEMFSPLKSYFLSQEHPPILIKRLFENEMSQLYLWHMHSLMSMFHGRIQVVERANNSVAEVLENLELVHNMLVERKNENFMSLTVERLPVEKGEEGYKDECNNFFSEVANLYDRR